MSTCGNLPSANPCGWRFLKLMLACSLLLTVWLVALPRLGKQRPVRRYLDWTAEHQLNPSAMFYTEVPRFEDHIERAGKRAGDPPSRPSPRISN